MHRMKKNLLLLSLLLSFLLGCHNGYVALWTDGSANPNQVFPYPVISLPPEDQKALENGIHIESTRQLAQLLEDYLS